MERRAYILSGEPTPKQIAGISNCRRSGWQLGDIDHYPYKPYCEPESFTGSGVLAEAIRRGHLHTAVMEVDGEVKAHAALVWNSHDSWELGRVFAEVGKNGYGSHAVNACYERAEELGISEIHIGAAYNRTAMPHSLSKVLEGRKGYSLAFFGLLVDLYSEQGMVWGENMIRSIKDGKIKLPNLSSQMPIQLRQFAIGIQNINIQSVEFDEKGGDEDKMMPYQFHNDMYALSWHDYEQQRKFLNKGFRPIGIIKMHDREHFVMYKGKLPKRIEGRGEKLLIGRNPVFYEREVGGVAVHKVMDLVYQQ